MNALTPQPAMQLPAHLAGLASQNTALAAMGGITVGGSAIHQIGIKTSRWRLQDPQGTEQVLPTHYVDVIIADANPNLSKVFYIEAYNPADTEAKAPDCWSDNGVAPSFRASKPQCTTCAACPHNVWGSKVTAQGNETKACADSKKLAIILADNPTGPVYLIKIPAASLKNMYNFVEQISNRGIPLPALVVRLEFDPSADYPKITFTPAGWASEAQYAALQKVLGSEEIKAVMGTNDKPRDAAAPAIAAPVAQPAPFVPVSAPAAPAPVVAPVDPFAALGAAPMAQLPVSAEAPPKRKRRSKAEIEAAQAASDVGAPPAPVAAAPVQPMDLSQFAAPAPQPVMDIPGAVAAAPAVKVAPQPTNSALDDLISKALAI